MTVEGLERLVDFYAAGSQLAGLAFCVNMQRALFESSVWETLIDDYDPALGDDQPALKRSGEARGMAALRRNGANQFKVWLDRTRHHGIEAFLTMRMNDCHGLEGHGDFWTGHRSRGSDQGHFSFHATEFWKRRPDLRRAPYRFERSFEGAFNYAEKEVQAHHLALIAEVMDRYDMDGFELDWMRWMFMFRPGYEAEGCQILCGFLEKVLEIKHAAERKWGHPIQLRHRIPAEPQTCLALGYDVPAWVDMGAADQIILSCFGSATNFDYPIALWRRLVGKQTKILALVESVARPYPGSAVDSYHFLFAAASAALERGADGVYLFNECYGEPYPGGRRELLSQMLNTLGSPDTLANVVRRHAVTYPQVRAAGEGIRTSLPVPLINSHIGVDPGRWAENITVRIAVGRKVESARHILRLGFSGDTNLEALRKLTFRVNAEPVLACEAPSYPDCMPKAFPTRDHAELPEQVVQTLHFEIPYEVLKNDVNVVEFEPLPGPGQLEWAEILVLPT